MDNKRRIRFTVVYKDGSTRNGVLYDEGNIKMSDGTLVARLDLLRTESVVAILFHPEET